jgi:hypothetical protein
MKHLKTQKQLNETSENLNISDVMNSKLNLYKNILSLFISKLPDDKIILDYFTKDDAHLELQDWIGMNLRKEIYWSTAIGVIEACDLILNEARSNGNLKSDYSISRNV